MEATSERMRRYRVWQGMEIDMEHIVSGEVRDYHVARMRFYADKNLHVTRRLMDLFQHLEHQAGYHIEETDKMKKAPRGDEYLVLVRWMELDEKATWASVSWVLEEAPVVLKRERKNERCV